MEDYSSYETDNTSESEIKAEEVAKKKVKVKKEEIDSPAEAKPKARQSAGGASETKPKTIPKKKSNGSTLNSYFAKK